MTIHKVARPEPIYAGQIPGCVFCHKANELAEVPGDVVFFEPLNPVTRGHVLFVPWVHIRDARDNHSLAALTMAAAAAYAEMEGHSYNLITSGGREATQTVPHFHLHYVPRHDGDGLHLPWTGQAPLGSTE